MGSNREKGCDKTPVNVQYHLPVNTLLSSHALVHLEPQRAQPLLRLRLHYRRVYEALTDGPFAPAGAPTRNPLLNLRLTVLRYRMRPVPVVFLRLAFSPQLSVPC